MRSAIRRHHLVQQRDVRARLSDRLWHRPRNVHGPTLRVPRCADHDLVGDTVDAARIDRERNHELYGQLRGGAPGEAFIVTSTASGTLYVTLSTVAFEAAAFVRSSCDDAANERDRLPRMTPPAQARSPS